MSLICIRGFIISMSERLGVLRDGLISFSDKTGYIEDVVEWDERSRVKCDVVEGDGYSIVIPGLINAHTHAPMYILQGLGAGLTGFDWLKKIWCIESFLKPRHVYLSTKASILTMLENGITAFADHYFHEEEVVRAVEETGVRGVLAKTTIDYSEHAPRHTIEESIEFARRFHNTLGGRVRTMIGVHALYSCSVETVSKAIESYWNHGLRIHMHFSESLHEIKYIREKYNTTPTELASRLGLLEAKPLLAHATYLSNRDIEILSGFKVYIAYSPFTIMNWGQGIARVGELMEKGLSISLATDGPVTDGDLSLFKQMKLTMATQSSRYKTPMKLKPREVLEMATRRAAEALGIDDLVGVLKPGMKADIVVLKPPKLRLIGLHDDPYATVVYNLGDESVSDVYVDGRKLVSNRVPLNIDIDKLREQLIDNRSRLLEEADICK